MSRNKKLVYGIGINDISENMSINGKDLPFYDCWSNMLKRCYSKAWIEKYPTYKDCSVCEDWLSLSKFKIWYDLNYTDGWQIDKDLLSDSKIYSPKTCCFIPSEINTFLANRQKKKSELPIGVYLNGKKFKSAINDGTGKLKHLGTFNSIDEAFKAYCIARNKRIIELCDKYHDNLNSNVINVLLQYKEENRL